MLPWNFNKTIECMNFITKKKGNPHELTENEFSVDEFIFPIFKYLRICKYIFKYRNRYDRTDDN